MEFAEGHTVGIDLGTRYSAIAHLNNSGMAEVINNAQGEAITGSVLSFEAAGCVRVGDLPPKAHTSRQRIVTAVKRVMGNPDYSREFDGRQLNPELLSALILRKLKQDAEEQIGPIGNAVISVPYYFNDPCRQATIEAGRLAGLQVIDLINEPTAATLAHAWSIGDLGRDDKNAAVKRILLFDLGGGTFDVTIVRYTPTHFEVLATDGDTFLGGLDWTARIEDYVCEQFQKTHNFDPREDDQFAVHLTEQCESAKHRLSQASETRLRLECAERQLNITITRARFEDLTADLLQRAADTTQLVLQDGGVNFKELDDILLVGGSTHMPAVTEMFAELCQRTPLTPLDPQLAVAQGAAVHAAILEARATRAASRQGQAVLKRLSRITTQDVNAHALGVELTDRSDRIKRNHVMIPRNSQLPIETKQQFVTTDENPDGIRIRLLEGEATEADACVVVGDCRISNLPPDLPAGSPVEVRYSYDARRRIQVTARELTGENEASVQIVWESGNRPNVMEKFKGLADAYTVR